ncbi:MAG: D-hexose-6-phosphate mutarotase [Thermodesulfobacteriota bacterium]
MDSIDDLNKRFGIPGQIAFKGGPGGLTVAEIKNQHAAATLFLHGAHVTSFKPHGQEEVLFLSGRSGFESGKAIRGGIPISWPWFADNPTDKDKPAHGFARISNWDVRGTEVDGEASRIRLGLSDNQYTRLLWPHAFDLEFIVTVGKELHLDLIAENAGEEDFTISQAFHSYYHISEINKIFVQGLEGGNYIDKVDSFKEKYQVGGVRLIEETDRIYLDTANDSVIHDPGLKRRIRIRKEGSRSTVIWNPWIVKARQMKDLGDQDYKRFVCVETTNAGEDLITVAPGSEHILRANIGIETQ